MNIDAFLSKLSNVVHMARAGATDGERAAGLAAIERLLDRARRESATMMPRTAETFLAEVTAAAVSLGVTPSSPVGPSRADPGAQRAGESDPSRSSAPGYGMGSRRNATVDLYI